MDVNGRCVPSEIQVTYVDSNDYDHDLSWKVSKLSILLACSHIKGQDVLSLHSNKSASGSCWARVEIG